MTEIAVSIIMLSLMLVIVAGGAAIVAGLLTCLYREWRE
jgi:hypothetical protein